MENNNINEYLEKLSSTNYTPGGGSAVCVVSNIAISLILKSINITMARKSFNDFLDDDKNKLENCKYFLDSSIKELNKLSIEDQKVFNSYMIAYKENKDLCNAIHDCFDVPYDTFIRIYECINISKALRIVDSIISDYYIGIDILKVALKSCLHTMKININGYKDLEDKYNDCLKKIEE